MIVEFVGCAGAGKTTLRRLICEQGIAERRVVAMPDLLLDRPLLRGITHPTAVNVVQELGGFPFLLGALRSEREFLSFARRMLTSHARTTFDRLNGMRGIARKVGMYHLAERRAAAALVLSDEGTLLSSYNLFVMTDVDFGSAELERFVRLAPMPAAVVYVRAPVTSLITRAHRRSDPRRQHAGKGRAAVECDVRRTVELFDLLVAASPLQGRVLVVDNDDQDADGQRRLADEIARRLQVMTSTETPVRAPSSGTPQAGSACGAGLR